MSGTLHGVGVGPGDPELLTLKAARVIAASPVIAYPAPLERASLARSIVAGHIPPGRDEIVLPMPFDPGRSAQPAYDAGAVAISDHLAAGRDVACLCLGDPLFYGSFIGLAARLEDRFPIEVVPGVTAVSAGAALLGRGLAGGAQALAIVPATRGEAEIERLVEAADSAAIIKLGRHLPKVVRVLERTGMARHACFVENAGLPGQRIGTLADMREAAAASYFALILTRRGAAEES